MEYSLFGCKVNRYYLNQRLHYFRIHKKSDYLNKDVHLLASCVVTDASKDKRIKHICKLVRKGKKVYITGCGAFEKGNKINREKFFLQYKELQKWEQSLMLLGESPPKNLKNCDLQERGKGHVGNFHNIYTRKFVLIQGGCDTHCTFCLTILKRGKHYSRPMHEILDEIKMFVDTGGKEIVLTGVNLASWGSSHTRRPNESRFAELLYNIIKQTSIQRIRISSLGPEFLNEEFFDIIQHERFMPHFHFSIQHFDEGILRSMNRNYTPRILDYVLSKIRNLKRKDCEYISIGADLIVGFPGESDEAFEALLSGVRRYSLTKIHAFPFSPHVKGEPVPAGGFSGQISDTIKKERMKELLKLGNSLRIKFLKKNKQKQRPVLLESKKHMGGNIHARTGRTPNYIRRYVVGSYKRGDIVFAENDVHQEELI